MSEFTDQKAPGPARGTGAGAPLMSIGRRHARRFRPLALLLAPLVVVMAACGANEGGNTAPTSSTSSIATEGTSPTLASKLVFGSGTECPTERYCLAGLEKTYGLKFKQFIVTDPGGAKTAAALQSGKIDGGVLFTTDPRLSTGDFVLLKDDHHLQPAENVTPVLGGALAAAHGKDLAATIDAVSAVLSNEALTKLNGQVMTGTTSEAAAAAFLRDKGLAGSSAAAPRTGPTIVVGSANFESSSTLAQLYGQALRGAGFPVELKLAIGNRNTYFPMITSGQIGLFPEYVGSLLGYLDHDAPGISDTAEAHDALAKMLKSSGLLALNPAPAQDQNGIVVTKETANRYGLTKVSDLGKPAR
ncbi:glycine betaine ABC transporter substrate-binding protein [Arthrobacter sp. NPDC058127]|uniref:glycine betaine ABC transporter substrate-binding protein n=1 Tax=Arthrobacter sp. NPDC058127 TaxID=3346351 RepID=UPI0036EB828C